MYKSELLIDIIPYLCKNFSLGLGDVVRLLWTKLDATIPWRISKKNKIEQTSKAKG